MPERIPQGVAITVPLKAYSSADHVTPMPGQTIAVVIDKNMGGFANPSAGATNATEDSLGWYSVTLSTTDTGTLGPLIVRGTCTGVDPIEVVYDVVSATNLGASNLDAAISSRLAPAGTLSTVTTLTNAPTGMPTDASVQADVLAVLNTAITSLAANPTAGSVLQYLQALKWALLNKLAITDANGNTVGYKDDDATQAFSVSAMFTDNSTTTTRLRPL
jgi:hypothetical protein